jgi:hypothetical protein
MDNTTKSYCQRCNYETNHSILFKESYRSKEEEEYDYALEYMVVKCLGCENISFRKEFIDIESSYPDEFGDWNPYVTITTYPKKNKVAKKLGNAHVLPEKIKSIYDEAINSFNADCLILTGVAFRAVIEAICIEENITGNNLEKKINNLVRQKLITEKEAKRLHSIRFIGNDSVHEMKIPKEKSLIMVLNIIEHLLNNIYLIDYDSEGILETIIDKFPEFEQLLNQCVRKINNGDEIPLAKILNKNVRRFNGKLSEFETELIGKINNKEYANLLIGKIDVYGNDTTQRQHFIINFNR